MKRFIRYSILFIPIFLIAYPIFVCIGGLFLGNDYHQFSNISYRPGYIGQLQSRVSEIETLGDVDILVIGSSHAYRGFDPRIFDEYGVRLFNFGSSSQSPIQTEYFLNKYLTMIDPDTVILDVFPVVFSLDGIESSLDIVSNDRYDKSLLKFVCSSPDITVINTYIYRSFAEFIWPANREMESGIRGDDRYIPGGYVESQVFSVGKHSETKLGSLELLDYQLEAFAHVIEILKSRDIPYLIVQTPITHTYYSSMAHDGGFEKLMSSYGDYYNYNELITLNDSIDFLDSHHLNQRGVRLFDEHLLEHVLKRHKRRVDP